MSSLWVDDTMRPSDPYALIEQWWGEPLSSELIKRISGAPVAHLRQFRRDAQADLSTELAQISEGQLRPALMYDAYYDLRDETGHFKTALNLLLYSHQVCIGYSLGEGGHVDRASLARTLTALLDMEPLASRDAIKFVLTQFSRAHHPSRSLVPLGILSGQRPSVSEWQRFVSSVDRSRNPQYRERAYEVALFHFSTQVGSMLNLAARWPSCFQLLARSDAEQVLMEAYIRAAGQESVDLREVHLRKLARVDVPNLSFHVRGLAGIRESDEVFGEWRRSVSSALSVIREIPDYDNDWAQQARGILIDELTPMRERIEKSVHRSAALTAAKDGLRSLAFSGVGAGAGALVGGSFVTAAAGAAAGKSSEFAVNYLRALRQRRNHKALLDLLVSFTRDRVDSD